MNFAAVSTFKVTARAKPLVSNIVFMRDLWQAIEILKKTQGLSSLPWAAVLAQKSFHS